MSLALSCREATALMTGYLEGDLPLRERLGLRVHLSICPRCRSFLASLRKVPDLVRRALQPEPEVQAAPAPAAARSALAGALSAIRGGQVAQAAPGPALHPPPGWLDGAERGQGDGPMHLMVEAHRALCPGCGGGAHTGEVKAARGRAPLPEALRAQLPPETQWTRHTRALRGCEVAELLRDAVTGAVLYLVRIPAGVRFPHHAHVGEEAALVLAGEVQDGKLAFGTGDWMQYPDGTEHAPMAKGDEDCWVLIRTEREIRFLGWRRWLQK